MTQRAADRKLSGIGLIWFWHQNKKSARVNGSERHVFGQKCCNASLLMKRVRLAKLRSSQLLTHCHALLQSITGWLSKINIKRLLTHCFAPWWSLHTPGQLTKSRFWDAKIKVPNELIKLFYQMLRGHCVQIGIRCHWKICQRLFLLPVFNLCHVRCYHSHVSFWGPCSATPPLTREQFFCKRTGASSSAWSSELELFSCIFNASRGSPSPIFDYSNGCILSFQIGWRFLSFLFIYLFLRFIYKFWITALSNPGFTHRAKMSLENVKLEPYSKHHGPWLQIMMCIINFRLGHWVDPCLFAFMKWLIDTCHVRAQWLFDDDCLVAELDRWKIAAFLLTSM